VPLLLGRRHQAADVILHRVDASRLPAGLELGLRARRLRPQIPVCLPGQADLKRRQILQRRRLGELDALPQARQIQNPGGEADGSLSRRLANGNRELAEDYMAGVEGFADLDYGRARQQGVLPQRHPAVNLAPVFAIQNQQPFGGKRVGDVFADTLAYPVQRLVFGEVGERKHDVGFRQSGWS